MESRSASFVALAFSSWMELEVEAVDGLDEADEPDLLEVVERLAAAGVAPRERANERHHALDQDPPGLLVALFVPAAEELVLIDVDGNPSASPAVQTTPTGRLHE
jgi:hypothetical protein